jgi:hypothetical protein
MLCGEKSAAHFDCCMWADQEESFVALTDGDLGRFAQENTDLWH